MTVGLGVGPRDLAGLAVARADLVDLERSDRSAARLVRLRRLIDVAMIKPSSGASERTSSRRDDRHQQERVLVAAGMDRVLSHVVVSVVMRVRRAADAVARLDVEADAVAFFEHHRGRPNLHLYLDDLVGLEPLPPQMLVIGSIRPR